MVKFLKIGAGALFPSWKKNLTPSAKQVENYLNRLGEMPKIPFYLKFLLKSPKLQKIVNFFI